MHKFHLTLRGAIILGAMACGLLLANSAARATAPPSPISFGTPVPLSVTGAAGAWVADMDGDGHQDILTFTPSQVTVLYGDGAGNFTPLSFPTTASVSNLTVADFNGDGKKDIAITTYDNNVVLVLLATGPRAFAPYVSYPAGLGAAGITAGNFNADNKPDLAIANNHGGNISILLNNGDGTFAAPVFYNTGAYPVSVAVADFNSDHILELVVGKHYDSNSPIFYGDGLGAFPTNGAVAAGGGSVLVTNLNAHGPFDVAAVDYWNGGLTVALGDGLGNFPTTHHYSAVQYTAGLAAADFNCDGFNDLVTGYGAQDYFTYWTNMGTGDMAAPVQVHTSGNNARDLDVGDFNEDGLPDVVVDGWADHLSIVYNNTNPVPTIKSIGPGHVPVGGPAFTVTVGGLGMIATSVINCNGGALSTTFHNGILTATIPANLITSPGTLSVTVTNPAPGGTSSAWLITINPANAVDFNADGHPDLVLQSTVTNKAAIWYMNGATLTGGAYPSSNPPAGWHVVGVGDFNGDGKADLVLQNATNNQVAIWYMNGVAVTGGAYTSTTPGAGWRVAAVADLNGDTKPDLVLQNTSTNKVAFWYMNGATLTGGVYTSSTPASGWLVAGAGDFNGDTKPDLVLQNTSSNQVAIWYMSGATVTGGAYTSTAPPAGWLVAGVGDLNADTKADLILQNTSTNKIALWYMNGAALTSGAYTSTTPAAEWKVVGPK